MLRAVTALALTLFLAGCAPAMASAERVRLLTGPVACYAGGGPSFTGRLTADPEYGTRFNGKPAIWPWDYTGVRNGSEVAVLDGSGRTVATTGGGYYFSQPFILETWKDPVKSLGAVGLRDCGRGLLLDCSGPRAAIGYCGMAMPLGVDILGAFIAFWALDDRWRLFGVAISVGAGLLGLYMGMRIVWVLTLLAVSAAAFLLSRRLRV